jgi:HEAT repeat protein
VLAEIQTRRHRKLLCKVVEDWAAEEPQRLGAWIADPRWHVVRNIAYILGQIGTQGTVPLLATLTEHPEPRVQLEAVNALGNVDAWHTRSIFRRLLEHRDPKVFVAAVTQLAQARDPELGRMFVQFITHPDFSKRSDTERRAVYRAVAQTGGPEVVRDLEAEIHRGGWLVRNAEEHRQEVARCLAAIGGHEARAALERALQSRRTPVRRAAEIALAGFDSARGREAA